MLSVVIIPPKVAIETIMNIIESIDIIEVIELGGTPHLRRHSQCRHPYPRRCKTW